MYLKRLISLFFIVVFFVGCSNTQLNNTAMKKAHKNLGEVAIISYKGAYKIKYKSKVEPNICKKNMDYLFSQIFNKTKDFVDDFKLGDVKVKNFDFKSKVKNLLVIRPYEYVSTSAYTCDANSFVIDVFLYNSENLTKNWTKTNKGNLRQIHDLPSHKLIWMKQITINFNNYNKNSQINKMQELFPIIIKGLQKDGIIKSINKEEIKKLSIQRSLKRVDCIPYTKNFTIRSSKNILCLGNLGFSNIKLNRKVSNSNVINASNGLYEYSLDNSSCKNIVTSFSVGNNDNSTVSFKNTYKEQILDFYNNKCVVKNKSNINFLECTKNDKTQYFLENSKKIKNKIYEKYLIQVDNMCFNSIYNNFDSKEKLWRTPYGYNSEGWNAFGINKYTKTKYDKDGFNYNGWNKQGINKYTKTKYDKDGFSLNGENIYGVDKDGWSSKLKKFIKMKRKTDKSFNIITFKSVAKNKIYNRSFYDKYYILMTKNGTRLIGEKRYPKLGIIKKYYFVKSDGKEVINFKQKGSRLSNDIKLEKIVEEKI
ncbi:hypothetical protein CPU12_06025 [Malaciobacter molluscorum LMG 25693]|uniref:Uncharacterized protein n=1 Tax=Malaciobacter molluscorum LMG 25693 TaxID=870501 RepID=A0A2G1DIN1_9BACT|nr:hypothetical protein [Malaciobacter molluscorum]AXX91865.1 hypothetical protein AMOL_0871 [Malaciobacter molluscorum LMG 25693]PHO18274.1 hypothetical protein CPU12_06025 [Malaciobacter molluscorum LMG 25693]